MELNPVQMLFSSDYSSSVKGKTDTQSGAEDEPARAEIRKLKEIDGKVRAHEAAHLAAAGGLAQGTSYGYKKGPDGKLYAVSGEVKIDTSPVLDNPKATATKMGRVRAAALAPADPSPQDMKVAAEAAKAEQAARQNQMKQSPTSSTKTGEKRVAERYSSSVSGASPKNTFDKFM
jgi:hypothetical protein